MIYASLEAWTPRTRLAKSRADRTLGVYSPKLGLFWPKRPKSGPRRPSDDPKSSLLAANLSPPIPPIPQPRLGPCIPQGVNALISRWSMIPKEEQTETHQNLFEILQRFPCPLPHRWDHMLKNTPP